MPCLALSCHKQENTKTRQYKTRQGRKYKSRQDETRQGKARQGKSTRQGKARQGNEKTTHRHTQVNTHNKAAKHRQRCIHILQDTWTRIKAARQGGTTFDNNATTTHNTSHKHQARKKKGARFSIFGGWIDWHQKEKNPFLSFKVPFLSCERDAVLSCWSCCVSRFRCLVLSCVACIML
jgi:hypothetical protein